MEIIEKLLIDADDEKQGVLSLPQIKEVFTKVGVEVEGPKFEALLLFTYTQ